MLIVNGTTISMINGDSETISITLLEDGLPITLNPSDVIVMTIKKFATNETVVLQKTFVAADDGSYEIELQPADTINMIGEYVYDIQLTYSDGAVNTLYEPSKFIVNRGVTT